ncbi:furin-like protease 1 isoform X3 [Pseudomyrmex gracilis]|uniref:furin-like protease 1 isoform X3 n=1 Tax=Pseudomyrmex gracilis TaxID=219809 RepID=UPI000994FC1F|nr:furin-like protease 1 isoform X3 [Pseudomyrmex gracilis]
MIAISCADETGAAGGDCRRRRSGGAIMCTRRILGLAVVALLTFGGRARAYTNQWAAHIEGGEKVAKQVAEDYGFRYLGKINNDWFHMEHRSVEKRSTEPHLQMHQRLMKDFRVRRAEQQRAKSRTKRDLIIKRPSNTPIMLNDDRWPQMWYLNRGKGLDMNVQGAWAEGITGNGVVVTILDDGLEKDHPDLLKNYDPQASYDVNSHDEDPMPRYDMVDSNRHGTRCAGEVAATANNSLCSVGVAFGAGVGGVRMLDGDVTDAVEARSLSLNPQHIDIYSASWGPDDDGKTVDGPGELATRAFIEGITKGRNGKGSIFVWASGNGGRDHDNCNCDGYTNSIWTLSISSATENGYVPWYSEACSSTLATTYSSGSTGEKQVVTTDLHHHCTSSHTGTSASAPLAAGICALALEANKDLTWRDMQHIVVRTAKPANLQASDWVVNGVGRNVSHSFGYGLMDATAMVRLARRWRTVPEQHKCEVSAPHTGRQIPPKSQLVLDLHVKECSGVNFLEHVQAKVSLMAARRGDLQIQLTSPQGTKSTLLAKRPHDVSKAGFTQWPFMSVHTWGERPHGIWKLEIHNEGRYFGDIPATLEEWKMVFFGTETSVEVNDELDKDKLTPPVMHHEVSQNHAPSDIRHNAVDTEGDPWTGSQQVERVSHPEVQRPTTENQTSGCAVFNASGGCLACKLGWYHNNSGCLQQCPSGTYAVQRGNKSSEFCIPCHYSCLSCKGPTDADCVSCHTDSILTFSNGDAFCILSNLSWKMQSTTWYYRMTMAFLINLSLIILVIVCLMFSWYIRRLKCTHKYSKVSYGNGETHAETEQENNTCVSDSE